MIWYATAFWTGAVVLVLEVLGTRLMAPLYGGTIYVWSSLITVTLASLACGYAGGGALADRPPAGGTGPARALALRLGALLAASAAWLFLVPFLRLPVLTASVRLGVQAGVLAASAVLLAPPLALLGAVGPLIARLRATEPADMGRAMGNVSAVSTLGSVLGALAAGFWLIPHLRASRIIPALAFSLFALAGVIWLLRGRSRALAGAAAALALAAGLSGALRRAAPPEGLRMQASSLYGDILVVDRPDWQRRVLYIDGIPNTVVDLADLRSASDYIQSFELARYLRPAARKALLVGLGGGALPGRLARFGIATDVVDIDPGVVRAATDWFGYRPTGELHLEDGRRYLSRPGPAYDLIYLDAFNGDQHPAHMFTLECMRSTAARLGEEGVLVINLIGYAMGPRAALKRSVMKTLREAFPNVRLLSANTDLNPARSFVNMTFLASRGPLELRETPGKEEPELAAYLAATSGNWIEEGAGEGEVITDDRNPVESLGAPAFLAIRQRDLASNLELIGL